MNELENKLKSISKSIYLTKIECRKASEFNSTRLLIMCNRLSERIELLKEAITDRASSLAFNEKHKFNRHIYLAKVNKNLLDKGNILYQMVRIKYPTTDRKMPNAIARQSAYRLLRDYGYTFTMIAKIFDKDHSTVIHGCNTADALIFTKDKKFLDIYTEIKDMFALAFAEDEDEEKPFCELTEDELIALPNEELCTL